MDIKRIINKNGKLIWYIALIIVFSLFGIKSLDSYYEKREEVKKIQAAQDEDINNKNNADITEKTENIVYSTKSKSSYKTISSFVNYCNKRESQKAYEMLTDECKKEMFPTVEQFENLYINNLYKIERQFELTKWATDGNKTIYLITLYGDILSTGGTDNYVQDYYTLVQDDSGFYKLNINGYIYGEERNIETTVNNVKIKIQDVNIYEEYEEVTITITNNTSKKICLTGNKYSENIYLMNGEDLIFSSLSSEFDSEEIIMEPNETRTYIIEFNKLYSSTNKAKYLVLDDVIFDYDQYLNSDDKENYSNRKSIKIKYVK